MSDITFSPHPHSKGFINVFDDEGNHIGELRYHDAVEEWCSEIDNPATLWVDDHQAILDKLNELNGQAQRHAT